MDRRRIMRKIEENYANPLGLLKLGLNARQLRVRGITASTLRRRGFLLHELRMIGFGRHELIDAGFQAKKVDGEVEFLADAYATVYGDNIKDLVNSLKRDRPTLIRAIQILRERRLNKKNKPVATRSFQSQLREGFSHSAIREAKKKKITAGTPT